MDANHHPKQRRVSVYHRKARGTYSVRWRDTHGTQHEDGGYTSREAAEEHAVIVRRELRGGLPRAGEVRVGELVVQWWEHGTRELKPGTRDLYRWAVKHLGTEPIVDMDASTLTTADVNKWSRSVRHAPGTTRVMLTVLSAAYRHAVEEGMATGNPIRGARRPKEARQLVVFPEMEDVLRLAMTPPGEQWRAMLLVAAFCGLRQGELFALRWSQVSADTITVREALSGTLRERTTPKTARGLRLVPVPGFVASVLAEWRTESGGRSGELVFPTKTGAGYSASTFSKAGWKAWRVEAGTDIMWRHLRHFAVATWAASGASLLQCSRWAGHGSVSTTLDRYGAIFDVDTPGVMSRVAERVGMPIA
jgi:integrase